MSAALSLMRTKPRSGNSSPPSQINPGRAECTAIYLSSSLIYSDAAPLSGCDAETANRTSREFQGSCLRSLGGNSLLMIMGTSRFAESRPATNQFCAVGPARPAPRLCVRRRSAAFWRSFVSLEGKRPRGSVYVRASVVPLAGSTACVA
jgi:hypothetical protein